MSYPEITSNKAAASSTVLAKGPIWSREEAKAIKPYLETLPYVGFIPTMPQKLAGSLILPPVSEPRASAASQDATDAAEPPEEPPGTLFKSQGL